MPPRRFRLGHGRPGVLFRVEHLALQVAFFDIIAIDQPKGAYSGSRQQLCLHTAQSPAAHDDSRGLTHTLLPLLAKFSETYLTAKPLWIGRIGQVRHRYATSLLVGCLLGLAPPVGALAQRVTS